MFVFKLDFDFDHALLMDVKDGTRPESVKVPEGKMGEDMKKLYESSEKGIGESVPMSCLALFSCSLTVWYCGG